jgi:hypothetical protein
MLELVIAAPLYVLPMMKRPSFRLEVGEEDAEDDTTLRPTIKTEWGLAAEWNGYRASFTAPVGSSDAKEGAVKTRYQDVKLGLRRGMFAGDVGFESYKGFNRTHGDEEEQALPGARLAGRFLNVFSCLSARTSTW